MLPTHYIHYIPRHIQGKGNVRSRQRPPLATTIVGNGFERPQYHWTSATTGPVTAIQPGDVIWLIGQLGAPWKLPPSVDARIDVAACQAEPNGYTFLAADTSRWFPLVDASAVLQQLKTQRKDGRLTPFAQDATAPVGRVLQQLRQLHDAQPLLDLALTIEAAGYDFVSYRLQDGTRPAFDTVARLMAARQPVFWDRWSLPRQLAESHRPVARAVLQAYLARMIQSAKHVWGIPSPTYGEAGTFSAFERALAERTGNFIPTAMDVPTLFISHIAEEAPLAAWLKQQLLQTFENLTIFVSSDGHSIRAGSEWLVELRTSLETAQLGLILCSPEAVARPWVQFEAGAIWLRRIPVIPLCHSTLTPGALPSPLHLLHALQLAKATDWQALYHAVATCLKRPEPMDLDFPGLAAAADTIIHQIAAAKTSQEIVPNPRVLCVVSEDYLRKDYALDVTVLATAFSEANLTVLKGTSSAQLRRLLAVEKFDIIHLVLEVDDFTGALNLTHTSAGSPQEDQMSTEGFVQLMHVAEPKLVVMATCHALTFAVGAAPFANIVATNRSPSGKELHQWLGCFYDLLVHQMPLYQAFDATQAQAFPVPMQLIRHKNMTFRAPR